MKFTYKGPISGATIDETEYLFHDGNEYDLPEQNKYVGTLVSLGHLIPNANTTKNKKGDK